MWKTQRYIKVYQASMLYVEAPVHVFLKKKTLHSAGGYKNVCFWSDWRQLGVGAH